ncbi:MAG: hypothetical protein L6V95_03990 [Candidatus Melainabacteria bacterium]|nr:MAG: hypothetical protein L6V95_03990 [Candidatus Melainabacteria bacterium]
MKSNKVSTIKINLPPKTMTEDIDELKLEHYFIAYIDFLGMKNMMNSDNWLINKFNNYCINDFSQYYIDSKNLPKLVIKN